MLFSKTAYNIEISHMIGMILQNQSEIIPNKFTNRYDCSMFMDRFINKINTQEDIVKETKPLLKDINNIESYLGILCSEAIEKGFYKTTDEILFNLITQDNLDNWCISDINGSRQIFCVKSMKDIIELLEFDTVNNLVIMPEIWFSPNVYKKVIKLLKPFDVERTKKSGRTAIKILSKDFTIEDVKQILYDSQELCVSGKFDFFPTPDELVKICHDLLEYEVGNLVLEPSAGTGNLIKDFPYKSNIVTVEANKFFCNILKRKYPEIINKNCLFEEFKTENSFDRIIMNPPFSKRLDAKHILKAFDMLTNDGILVAIHSTGILSGSDKNSKAFQKLYEKNGVFQKVYKGMFDSSGKGTKIDVVLSKFRKVNNENI